MKWNGGTQELYQYSDEGKACAYYYIWRESAGKWRAGRYWLGRDVDFRLEFSSGKVARWYCERYDEEKSATIVEEASA